jgi:carbon-monoxide dehydrogenase medium subunit
LYAIDADALAATVKPAPFGYHRAASVGDAVRLLSAYEGTARVIAGGQSLVPMMNMRLLRPDALVDLNGLAELGSIGDEGGILMIGALVRYVTLEYSPVVAERVGLLTEVVGHVGDRQVRNRGTIGGSLCQGDPTGEIPLACIVLGASVTVTGPTGRREIPVSELYAGSYATVLEPSDVVTVVSFPRQPMHSAFAEMCRRHNDFAVISVAVSGDRSDDGTWTDVRLGLGGVAATPVLAEAAGAVLAGGRLSDEEIALAGELALQVIDPPDDIRASAEYRRHLVPVYVGRVLRQLRATAETREDLT